jgi:hypothetical protein
VFAAFQLVTALLLLSAASSSFQAGPGLLKALARRPDHSGDTVGVLPPVLGRINDHHAPYWGVVVFIVASAAVVALAGGCDQELVLFYAVSVFLSFLAGLLAMARFSLLDRRAGLLALNVTGAVVVGFTLIINLARGAPLVSLAAALLVAAMLYVNEGRQAPRYPQCCRPGRGRRRARLIRPFIDEWTLKPTVASAGRNGAIAKIAR